MFLRTGCECKLEEGTIHIKQLGRPNAICYIKTRPYPGFATDVQSPLMAVLCKANGNSIIEESIFENRLQSADELRRMGGDITVIGNRCFIHGVDELHGATVRATDLRGGMALVIGGLMAQGTSRIENADVITRGYENLVEKLSVLGAKISTFS